MFNSKNALVAYIIYVALCVGFSNLFDLIFSTFLTKTAYVFSWTLSILEPIIFGVVTGYFVIYKQYKNKK